ncbi:MAG: alpha/beta hydrolase [Flavobacteriaceae bacterium]|nr:MAG: alpha/beta hydrolase [Flavobacteriaceae bacterium]
MDYLVHTLSLKPDYQGEVVAQLYQRKKEVSSSVAYLFIHGFADYFYQKQHGDNIGEKQMDFYALELRKYNQSKLPHQSYFYCRNLEEYFEEIDQSIEFLQEKNYQQIIIEGHSMGGLVLAMYLANGRHRDKISLGIFNGPFFDFNIPSYLKILLPASKYMSKVFPYLKDYVGSPSFDHYNHSLHKDFKGEWDFEIEVKSPPKAKVYYAWVWAIYSAQKELKKGLNIPQPLLVMHSDKSCSGAVWTDEIMTSDAVLNINHIKENAPFLGKNVEIVQIENAMHNVFLSQKHVREKALEITLNFIEKNLSK